MRWVDRRLALSDRSVRVRRSEGPRSRSALLRPSRRGLGIPIERLSRVSLSDRSCAGNSYAINFYILNFRQISVTVFTTERTLGGGGVVFSFSRRRDCRFDSPCPDPIPRTVNASGTRGSRRSNRPDTARRSRFTFESEFRRRGSRLPTAVCGGDTLAWSRCHTLARAAHARHDTRDARGRQAAATDVKMLNPRAPHLLPPRASGGGHP